MSRYSGAKTKIHCDCVTFFCSTQSSTVSHTSVGEHVYRYWLSAYPIPIGETQQSYICYIRDPDCCSRYSAYPSTCSDAGPGEAINPKAGWKISKYLWDVRKRESPLINVLSVGLFVHNSKCTHNTHSLVSRPKQPQHGSLPVSLARKEGLGIWPGITRIFGMSTIYLLVTSFSLNFILKKSSPRGNC